MELRKKHTDDPDKLEHLRRMKMENGKEVEEPEYHEKGYFADGIDADAVMRGALKAIDNGVCKWYNKKGGEIKFMVAFKQNMGFSPNPETGGMVPTNKVSVTYSRDEGFHCYPDIVPKGRVLHSVNE